MLTEIYVVICTKEYSLLSQDCCGNIISTCKNNSSSRLIQGFFNLKDVEDYIKNDIINDNEFCRICCKKYNNAKFEVVKINVS